MTGRPQSSYHAWAAAVSDNRIRISTLINPSYLPSSWTA
ncbi:hypothetical protein FRAAL0795 [Frankia alni ACN14a]|uniref:Uncharacterized protein n=1 Tax=Frankia alni (strain DSM 45986 / CECT 9034 / ACN14a) TaxID=326424 RepID=Q0RSJ8_FRAAA|nr:hypothetical protein FRAAL0795 [Frankia alni ACN14a]